MAGISKVLETELNGLKVNLFEFDIENEESFDGIKAYLVNKVKISKVHNIEEYDLTYYGSKNLNPDFVARFNEQVAKINIPKNMSSKLLRHLNTKKDIEKLISKIKTIPLLDVNSKNIEEDYKRCLRDETLESLIAIIKTSYFRNQSRLAHNKKMTDKDKYYYELAEKFLYNEIAYIYNTTYEDAKKYVLDKLN